MKKFLKYLFCVGAVVLAAWFITLPLCSYQPESGTAQRLSSFTLIELSTTTGEGDAEPTQDDEVLEPVFNDADAIEPDQNIIGTLHVRDKAFTIQDNVAAQTLKNNIGWLNNSSLPPEGGPCVLMGHRNTQFRILKDVEIGEQLVFEKPSGNQFTYEVSAVDILESDSALRFYASEESTIVLVTCYPFYYSGHAPQKYVVTAVIV